MTKTKFDECDCKRCNIKFNNKYVPDAYFIKSIDIYLTLCSVCRTYKKCVSCKKEFKHKQNQTCSKKCAEELKKKSYIKSCGTPHNFYKNSKSRKKWEDRLLKEEGIINVFQRDSVKEKLRETMNNRYGGWYSSTKEGKRRIRNVFFEKYGRNWIGLDIPEIYEAYRKTSHENWGTDHWAKSEQGKVKLSKIITEVRNSKSFKQLQINRCRWKDHEDIENIENYYFNVYKITERNLKRYGNNKFGKDWKNKRGIRNHHIDHVYPIIRSYYDNIPYELVGDISNLELIPASKNLQKGTSIIKIPNHIKNWINENKEN